MLLSPLPFLDTYSLSTSSLGCNALCMVISLIVLWSICLSSSLVHFRKGPEYLTRGNYHLLFWEFFASVLGDCLFHWSLGHSKSPQVSRALLSILADRNNAIVWMVSTRPLITIDIGVTFMCHSFFSSQGRSKYSSLRFRFLSVLPCGQPGRQNTLFDRFSF